MARSSCAPLLAAQRGAGGVSSGCGVESTDILEYVGMDSLPLSIDGRNHVLTLPQDYDYETRCPSFYTCTAGAATRPKATPSHQQQERKASRRQP